MKQVNRLAMPALFLGLLLLAIIWLNGDGLATAVADTHQIVEIVPNELETSTHVGNMYLSDVTGAPVVLYAVNYPVKGDTPEAMARQYLRENAALLHLQSPTLSDLEYSTMRHGPAGYTVRFNQVMNGIPVYKGVIAVHINNQNKVSYVTNDYKSHVNLSNLTAVLSSDTARTAALDYLGIEGNLRLDKTQLVIYQVQDQSYLAYQVNLIAESILGDWEIMVDAHTGELLKVFDTSYSFSEDEDHGQPPLQGGVMVTGTGTVFDPDPLSSAQATYGDTGYVDGNDVTTTQLDAELVTVDLLEIEFAGGVYTLKGPYAEIRDFDAPFKGLFTQATSTFNYNRSDDAFEAANTYYHIDSSMRYLNETLGLNILPYQYVGGVRFDPHGANGADNSYYSSSTGAVSFGEGGVDDAEDSDVIHHELGHGLHDWVTSGGLSQVNGLSEGIGDYWAQSYNRSLGNWTPADPAYHWVFNWDGHNPFWGGRTTNHPNLYPGGLTGSIHTDGQIWATCNMRVYDAIGKAKLDTAFWEGLGMTGSSTNQEQAAQAVYQAAIDMGYSTADLQDMYDVYITCVYNVPPVPTVEIVVDPTSLSSSQATNVQAVETLTISNTGTVNLEWTIEEANTIALQLDNTPAAQFVTGGGVQMILDDGSSENSIGDGGQFVWLNRFTPNPADFPIELQEIWVQYGTTGVSVGGDIDLVIHEDTDGDGNPGTGATHVATYDVTILATGSTWSQYTLSPTIILNGPGDVLIGAINRYGLEGNNDFPANLDQTASQGRSWAATYLTGDAANPPFYPADEQWGTIDSFGFPGNWLIRGFGVTATGCAVPSDIPWASVNPISGTVPAASADTIDVTFDSTGYAVGVYTATLCITSNDTDNPLITVPLTMTVTANNAPVANDDTYGTPQDTPLVIGAPGVLGNDSDVDGQAFTAVLGTDVSQGTLSFNADGSFVYTPTAGFQGQDSFTYTADDGLNSSNVATVTITIENTAPVAVADDYNIGRNGVLAVTPPGVLDNDSDVDGQGLTAVLDTPVANGTLALSADGSFIYTPTLGFVGEDSFTYTADDGVDSSNVATVTITVLNTAPVATADSYTATQDSVLTVTMPGVLANDSDGEGDGLTAVLITDVAHGTLSLNPDGSFVYTPTVGYEGSDSFTYQANDGLADSNVTTVTITVAPPAQLKIFLPMVIKN